MLSRTAAVDNSYLNIIIYLYKNLQILTVKELLKGKKLEYVQMAESTFKKAERKRKIGIKDQWNLF